MPQHLAILMFMPQGQEWLWILVVVLVLFGGSRLPQLMRGMGTGIKEFKQAIREDEPSRPDSEEKNSNAG